MIGRLRAWLTTLLLLQAAGPLLIAMLAWVLYLLGKLSKSQLLIAELAAFAVLAILAFVRRGAWWKAAKPRYVSFLVSVAGPVRTDVVQGLRSKYMSAEELKAATRQLQSTVGFVLLELLGGYEPADRGWVHMWPADATLKRQPLTLHGIHVTMVLALEELQRLGFVERFELNLEREGEARVLFSPAVREGLVLTLQELVRDRMRDYGRDFGVDRGGGFWGILAGSRPTYEEQRK